MLNKDTNFCQFCIVFWQCPYTLGDFTPFASLWAKYMAPGDGAFEYIGNYLFTISPPWPGGGGDSVGVSFD